MTYMHFDVVTLFPEMFTALTKSGVTGRACEQRLTSVSTWNIRDFCEDSRKTVDDRAYGGGPGMVMLIKPLEDTSGCYSNFPSESSDSVWTSLLIKPTGKGIFPEVSDRYAQIQQFNPYLWTVRGS